MGLIGLVVGLVNGSIVAYVLVDVNSSGTMDFLIPWGTIGLYTAIILSSAFFAAIIPGWLASRIPPSDALRYVG
ncbi:MAG: ABC transporter permease, partial [Candidatus Hodarchaeales archaeon]|jgi:ABC-type antimicrobial peptide transport system permease subunit